MRGASAVNSLHWGTLQSSTRSGLVSFLRMEEAERFCDRLCIIDHGRVVSEGDPVSLVAATVGRYTLEVEDPDEALFATLAEQGLRFDRSGRRLIVYGEDRPALVALRDRFCPDCGLLRAATLEDVFLRLTGRELRE